MAEQNNNQQQDVNQLLKVRYDKLHELQENGKDPFVITKYDVTNHSTDVKEHFEEMEGKEVSLAGRMMFKRVMGKASFCNIQDLKGRIQIYVARDSIGEESYADFKKYDVGDILGVKGIVFKTKTGEISIHAAEVTLLSKSLQILPEKFHGLTDTDTRYRQRYVDLIMNEDVKDTFVKRSKVISTIRRYLDGQGFMEVETPMLVSNAGGAAARPFETHFNALDEDLKLRISLELYLKRLIVGGMERVYEIGRVFRNEGLDTRHNPEFTLMELYQAYTDYHGMMDLTENLYRYVAKEVTGSEMLTYGEHTMDLSKPFERITMVDAVKKYAGVDFNEVKDTAEAKKLADEHHIEYEERHEKGDILNLFFEEYVEEHLIQPTFVMDHPIEISPLTKKKPENPDYVERFEFFINGWEMANAYSELNDPIDQRERFKAQEELLAQGDDEANTTDEDFMNALEIGMPPTGGIGFGIDLGLRYNLHGAHVDFGEHEVWASDGIKNQNVWLHTIEIPFNLRFKWTRMNGFERTLAPFVFGGPVFSFTVGTNDAPAIEHPAGYVAMQCGAGVELFEHWQISGGYSWGISYQVRTIKLDNYSAQNRGGFINVAYLF